MNPVIEAFRRLIPSKHKVKSGGAITFNCPACGDKRGRGWFWETPTGGFKYHCFNGGCEYTDATGWEPDSGFYGRRRRFFFYMGGDVSDIPKEYLERKSTFTRDASFDLEVVTHFPEIRPPAGSQIIWELTNKDAVDCQNYVLDRAILFVEHPFLWCPRYPRYVIYPLEHRKKPIGWIARAIDKDAKLPHLKCTNFPSEFMLNQEYAKEKDICLVQEGTFDAAALHSLCTFGSTLSRKQVNFLRQIKARGKRVVLLPDYHKEEWKSYWQAAKEHGFSLSIPNWPNRTDNRIKDAGESIRCNGVIRTVELIVDSESITDNHFEARIRLESFSRGND